ncbi:Beta-ketoacyl synthase [Beggiatoa sp. PS]|nr:Beta-ketoacyl synthase [Beggiatoa sp. PS]
MVLAGGSDTISDFTFSGFSALRAMTTDEIRPFDRHRKGLAVGEGAAIVILESLSHAQQRRAKIYAKIAGYGIYNDAYHSTAPDPKGKGMANSIQRALKMANLSPQDLQYINAHGTATQHNDKMESQAFHHVFGKHIKKLPVSSTKSMIGHTLGAAGAIEMVAATLAMKHHFIPPPLIVLNLIQH